MKRCTVHKDEVIKLLILGMYFFTKWEQDMFEIIVIQFLSKILFNISNQIYGQIVIE